MDFETENIHHIYYIYIFITFIIHIDTYEHQIIGQITITEITTKSKQLIKYNIHNII